MTDSDDNDGPQPNQSLQQAKPPVTSPACAGAAPAVFAAEAGVSQGGAARSGAPMTRSLVIALLCAATVARAQGMFALTFSRDLDGDGREETVSFEAESDNAHGACCTFVITVDGVSYPHRGISVVGPAFVVDVDSTDSFHEIAVEEYGPSDDDATYVFRYESGALVEIGTLPGRSHYDLRNLMIDGSGVVTTRCRGAILETWFYPCKYRMGVSGRLEEVREPLYPMSTRLIVLQDFDLQVAPDDNRVAVTLHAGDRITLVGSDDERWTVVECENGKRGWFEVRDYFILADGRRADVVFEGFSYAD